jgi:elongation factor Ts
VARLLAPRAPGLPDTHPAMTATFTAKDVQELRQRTGAGMMDCKKALEENQGNMEAAVDFLRKKGIAKAEKRAGKSTSEGVVVAEVNANGGILVEVNCETDFVARNEEFQRIAREVAQHALATASVSDADSLLATTMPSGQTVADFVKENSAKMGEAVNVRRLARVEGTVGKYVHFNGKIGALVGVQGSDAAEAQNLASVIAEHVAAASPVSVDETSIPADVIARERAIFEERTRAEGKPEAMVEKIVDGKLKAFYKEVALLHQAWIREPKQSIAQVVADVTKKVGNPVTVTRFVRFQLGAE